MKVLALGAHPDDIEIGMGGTIAKYIKNHHQVLMVVTTIPNKQITRQKEAEKASRILGAELLILGLNPAKMTLNRGLVRIFDRIIQDYNPNEVYTHWNHDSHQDHTALAQSIIAATRDNRCSVYMFEQTIPGGIVPDGFRAQSFIDISDTIEIKINSIQAHKSQVKTNEEWWLYGLKGRAMYRGYQINTNYAEAFEVVKHIKEIPQI